MKNLNFGCKRSDFLVTNSKDDWFIQCRFYEPDREKPFTYRRRLNRFKDEKERKQIEKLLLKQMSTLLDEKDYNPRTKQFMFLEEELNPNLSLSEALEKALERKSYTPEHVKVVESALNRFKINTEKLELDYLKVKEVELSVIAHEAKHVVNLVFRDRGILLDVDNDEPEAYFLDWVFEQIEKFFTNLKK